MRRIHGLVLVLILLVAGGIRLRLASMPLERDEGEYAYMAQRMLQGTPPYAEAYAMKFPGIYAAYAAILSLFGQTDTAIHMGLILVNAATIALIFLLGLGISSGEAGLWAAATYAVTSLGPSLLGITANAEHFIILPALTGFLFLFQSSEWKRLFIGGICFGLATSMKQQGLFFAIFGLIWVIYQAFPKNSAKATLSMAGVYGVGVTVPLLALGLWIWMAGTFSQFQFWCFEYARYYGNMWTLKDGLQHLTATFRPVLGDHAPIFLAALAGWIVLWRKNRTLFALTTGLTLTGFLATMPGLIFRPHYFLLIMPGLAISAAFGFVALGRWMPVGILALLFPLGIQHSILFLKDPESVCREIYPRNAFVETREVGQWLRTVTTQEERIAVLGSEPQINFYAGRRSGTPYLYMYPLLEPQPFAAGMQRHMMDILETSPSPYLVHVRVPTSWLVYPNSDMELFQWLPLFLEKHYVKERSIRIPDSSGKGGRREIVIYHRKNDV